MLGFAGLALAIAAADAAAASTGGLWYYSLMPPPGRPLLSGLAGGIAAAALTSGFAGWLVWRQPDGHRHYHAAFTCWAWQVGFSAVWAPLLFGLQVFLPALAATLLLAGAAGLTVEKFRAVNITAALLMLPVCAWVLFCAYLIAGFWWLNQ